MAFSFVEIRFDVLERSISISSRSMDLSDELLLVVVLVAVVVVVAPRLSFSWFLVMIFPSFLS